MDDYSPAMDSQAAFGAMPNQGLSDGLTEEQKQRIAKMLASMGTGLAARAGQPAPAQQLRALPSANQTQTMNGGQFINGMGGR